MRSEPIDIHANVGFLSAAEGGRTGPTPADQLRCIFEYAGECFDCVLWLDRVGSLSPGQRVKVPIAFLFPEYIRAGLRVGSGFRLRDSRTITEGSVLEIVERASPENGGSGGSGSLWLC